MFINKTTIWYSKLLKILLKFSRLIYSSYIIPKTIHITIHNPIPLMNYPPCFHLPLFHLPQSRSVTCRPRGFVYLYDLPRQCKLYVSKQQGSNFHECFSFRVFLIIGQRSRFRMSNEFRFYVVFI